MTVKIGAIWIVSKNDAIKIHSDFYSDLIIAVSECGEYWFGGGQQYYRFKVGDDFTDLASYIADDAGSYSWNAMRIAFCYGKLDYPIAGSSTLYDKIVNKYGHEPITKKKHIVGCICSFQRLIAMGCPSNRGKVCPTISGQINDSIYR